MNIFLLDLETTGLNPYHDSIIELHIKLLNKNIEYGTLVKPTNTYNGKFVTDKITNITKITHEEILNNGISQLKLCENLYKFLKNNTINNDDDIYIIAHNGLSFDLVFIRNLLRLTDEHITENISNKIHKIFDRIKCIDTLLLSKLIIKNINSYTQYSLCNHFNIETEGLHRAKNDVYALENIYNHLINISNIKDPQLIFNSL